MDTNERASSQAKARRTLARVIGICLGVMCSSAAIFAYWYLTTRTRAPVVTEERLSDAIALWEKSAPANYDIEVQLVSTQTETHRVEVRGGEVAGYWRNGTPMNKRRTIDTWTVPGMFSTLERDIENVVLVERGKADATTPRLTLWGTFHSQYGFPETYRRIQWGRDTDVSWEVVRFDVNP